MSEKSPNECCIPLWLRAVLGVDNSSNVVLRENIYGKGTITVHGIGKDLYQLQLMPLLQSPSGKVFKVLSNSGKARADSSLRLLTNCCVSHYQPPGSWSPPCPQDTKKCVAQHRLVCSNTRAQHQAEITWVSKRYYGYQTHILPSLAKLYNTEVFKAFLSLGCTIASEQRPVIYSRC